MNVGFLGAKKIRIQTSLQQIDVMGYYIDIPSSQVPNNGNLYIDTSGIPYNLNSSVLVSGHGYQNQVTPLKNSINVSGTVKIGSKITLVWDGYLRFYYNSTQFSGTSMSQQNYYEHAGAMVIFITTDDVYIPSVHVYNFEFDDVNYGYSAATTTQFGYVTRENHSPAFGIYTYTDLYNNMSAISDQLKGAEVEIEVDPYGGAGTTEEGGGQGSFDYTGDTIPEPSLPTVGAASTGFVSLFNPTATQLNDLVNYLWSSAFDLDTIKRLYADPMQQFIGLSLVPVPVPAAGAVTIQVGGISTGVTLTKASAQFVSIDCGTITFSSSTLTASYLDFLPYTKTQLYLPYIGIVDVSTDDIMDKSMSIKYHVDILTGGCIAYIIVGGSVMYQYSGQCAINIPLTSIDWSTTISSVLGLVSSAMNGLVAGAAVPLTGGLGAAVGLGGIANMGATAVNAATSAKPTINKSGAIGGSAGILAVQKPYLIVTCPNLARAKKQDYFIGYPSFITKYISECSGFCSFEEVYLSGLGLTDDEMEELDTILKEGVYL